MEVHPSNIMMRRTQFSVLLPFYGWAGTQHWHLANAAIRTSFSSRIMRSTPNTTLSLARLYTHPGTPPCRQARCSWDRPWQPWRHVGPPAASRVDREFPSVETRHSGRSWSCNPCSRLKHAKQRYRYTLRVQNNCSHWHMLWFWLYSWRALNDSHN